MRCAKITPEMSPISNIFFLCLLVFFSCLGVIHGNRIRYSIADHSKNKPGDKHTDEIGLIQVFEMMRGATQNVLEAFHHDLNKGKLRYDRVVLLVESFETHRARGHTLIPSSTVRNTIRLNSDYLQQYNGNLRREFAGLLYHESTRMWQNDGKGHAPRGLLTGIADYMRLKAGYPARTWRSRGSGLKWDEGFEVTAYFLEYCDGIRGAGDDFVSELNAMMKDNYSDEYFSRLIGRSVVELWGDYVKYFQYGKRESEYNQHMGNLAAKKLRGSVKLITFEVAVTY